MDLSYAGATLAVRSGKALRLTGAEGRRISAVSGALWVTLDGDARDIVLENGADLLVDRAGGVLVQALGGPALVALEDGVRVAQPGEKPHVPVLDHLEIDRQARRARAEAIFWLFAELRGLLARLKARVGASLTAARTRDELRSLSDHVLKDIGLSRSHIDCLVR